jgi:hypothetical protein
MGKKRISSVDLAWVISEELHDRSRHWYRTSLAVVSGKEVGWRVVVDNRGRRFLTAADQQRLAAIQRKLRLIYQIQS